MPNIGGISSYNAVASLPCYDFAGHVIVSEVEFPELGVAIQGERAARTRPISIALSPFAFSGTARKERIHQWPASEGGMVLHRVPTMGALQLDFPDLAEVLLSDGGHRLTVRPLGDESLDTLRHLLMDQILPRVLGHLGEVVLHAAAVRIGDRIVAFTGSSGAGKSTLGASFASDGDELLSDDGVVLTQGSGKVSAMPTYASLRLWPESLKRLYISAPPFVPMAHYTTKKRVLQGPPSVITTPLPLAALYVLEKEAADNIEITRLSPVAACMSIVSNCFQFDVTDTARAAQLLWAAGTIAACVPVFTISFPRDFACLPKVRDALRSQWSG